MKIFLCCIFLKNCSCGIIHEGDRILSVNGINLSMITLAEAHRLLAVCHCTCNIRTEYDITGKQFLPTL